MFRIGNWISRETNQNGSYFRNESANNVDTTKLDSAPLTNLGCESEFSKFDHRVKVTGGSTSIQTHSKKNIVVTNGLLIDSAFKKLPENEKKPRVVMGQMFKRDCYGSEFGKRLCQNYKG